MAGRASGRHRDPGPWGPLDQSSLLMMDYLETSQFRRRRRRFRKLGSGVRRLTADERVLAVAAIVAVVLAVLVGTSLPLRSTQAGPGRPSASPSAAPQSAGASAAPSLAQPSATSPAASPSARSTASPGGASPGAVGSNGGGSHQARPAATAGTPAGASPASSAAATRRAAQVAPAVSAVVVTFSVTSRDAGIFQGKVQIVNDGTKPLASWQLAVALPGDRVVAVANASGLVVRGVLLLEPAPDAAPVPAGGGVLNVFFVAVGSQPVSGACTFNQVPCG